LSYRLSQRDLLERRADAHGNNAAPRPSVSQPERGFDGVRIRRIQDVRQQRALDHKSAPFDFDRRLIVDNACYTNDDC
jgi:hypothetical protein